MKQKPKEIDWREALKFQCYFDGKLNYNVTVDFIEKLLTQQRTELLDEIKNLQEEPTRQGIIDLINNESNTRR